MRIPPLFVAVLVVAGIVAGFIVAEKKLRSGIGEAEGVNGVAVEQADTPDGGSIVVIRSRYLDETARYRANGSPLSRDLTAILEDDADRVGTFRILLKGSQAIGTERYDFDKYGRARTWTRYAVDGSRLCTRAQDEDTGVETWWDAAGTVISAKRAQEILAGDGTTLPLDAPFAASAPVPNGVGAGSVALENGGRLCRVVTNDLWEVSAFDPAGELQTREIGAILRADKRKSVVFSIRIRGDQVTGTVLEETDFRKKQVLSRHYGPDGVLLYTRRTDTALQKTAFLDPEGNTLAAAAAADIDASNGDENGIVIPVPVRK